MLFATQRFHLLILILLLCFCDACSSGSKPQLEKSIDKHSAIIFVPGFKGSILAKNEQTFWIDLSKAIYAHDSLALHAKELGIEPAADVTPKGILKEVGVLPFLYSLDLYGSFLKELKLTFPDKLIAEFSYDWREDNLKAVKSLADLVTKLKKEGYSSVSIVSHSMGGLITAYYLKYGAQDFESATATWEGAKTIDKVVFLGTPFLGSVAIVQDIQLGTREGLNANILNSFAYASFPSSYQLMPFAQDGRELNKNLYQSNFWIDNNLGLFKDSGRLSAEVLSARTNFLQSQLKSATAFHTLIHSNAALEYPLPIRVLNVIGKGRKTKGYFGFCSTCKEKLEFDGKDMFQDGDGTVTTDSASMPEDFKKNLFPSEISVLSQHSKLLIDHSTQNALAKFLK